MNHAQNTVRNCTLHVHFQSFPKEPIDGAKAFSKSPSHGQRKPSRASYKDYCRLSLSASSSLLSALSIVDRPSANTFQYLVVAIKVVASSSSPSFLCCYMAAWINANITTNQRAAAWFCTSTKDFIFFMKVSFMISASTYSQLEYKERKSGAHKQIPTQQKSNSIAMQEG